jgi:heptosyltransferase-2
LNLVVVSPNWLGDAVMALAAITDLRRHFGSARLTVAARRSVAPLFEMVDGVDAVLTLPGRGGLAAVTSWRADVAAIAAGAFDVAVLFPNSFAAALVASRAGVPEIWGYAADARKRFLTKAVPRPRGPHHQAGYYQALVAGLGITSGPRHARVTPPAGAAEHLEVASPYVVFAPGAAYGRAKQWPPERFAELAGLVMMEQKATVVLVGSRADRPVCSEIHGRVMKLLPDGGQVLNLSARTSLHELAALLAGSHAVVSNDSGAMHLAGAVGARVVAVFGSTNEHGTAPLTCGPDTPPPVVLTASVWCRPCMLRECPIDHRCMTGISPRDVATALG